MKFCTNCGNQLGNEKFCTKCGTPVPQDNIGGGYVNASGTAGGKGSNNNIILAGIAVVIIAAIVAGAFALFGGRSYKKVVKEYVEATLTGDAEQIISLMPDDMIDYILEIGYEGDRDDMIADLQEELDDTADEIADSGIDISDVSYKIVDVEDWDKEDLDDANEELEEMDIKIKAAKYLEIELTIPGYDEETTTQHIVVAKVGRSWCIFG